MIDNEVALLQETIRLLWQQVETLRGHFTSRKFTLDGRIVGDLGETLAELLFDIRLDQKSRWLYDAQTSEGHDVSIKAGFQEQLTFKETPDYMIGIALRENGDFEVVYNGPGRHIADHYSGRSGLGQRPLRFPVSKLKEIDAQIPDIERIPRRPSRTQQ